MVHEQNHGKRFKKLNNSLLNDKDYVDCVNRKIDIVILLYCLPVYNTENVTKMETLHIQYIYNYGNTWRKISYSSQTAKTK